MTLPVYAGIDIGASATKAVLIDSNHKVVGRYVTRSGHDFQSAARTAYREICRQAGLEEDAPAWTISTGYGRKTVPFAREDRTEIGCHAKGCFHAFPRAITLVDIGGQDNKVVKLDERGHRINFKMNRKCAAGTGAFIEEMANRLSVPLEELNDLAEQASGEVVLGSYCTVFSATEVLEKIRAGAPLPDLVKGIFRSVVKRVMEMETLTGTVVATGGVVAHNPVIVSLLEEEIGASVSVPPDPQCTGALGAALFALESAEAHGMPGKAV